MNYIEAWIERIKNPSGYGVGDLHQDLVGLFSNRLDELNHPEFSQLFGDVLDFCLLKRVFFFAGKQGIFDEIHRQAFKDLNVPVIMGVDFKREPAPKLIDAISRWGTVTRFFEDRKTVGACLLLLRGEAFLQFWGAWLRFDIAFAEQIQQRVYESFLRIDLQRHIAETSHKELLRRWDTLPASVRKMLGTYHNPDWFTTEKYKSLVNQSVEQCVKETETYLHRVARNHRLGDDTDKLRSLIQERMDSLWGKTHRAQWAEIDSHYKELKDFPRRIHDRGKNFYRDAKPFQSLDDTRGEEKIAFIEMVPDPSVQPPDEPSIGIGETFTDSQRERVREAFRKVEGANPETGLTIVEYMVKNGVVFTKTGTIKKSEIVEGLECEGKKIAPSTVGRYLGTKKRKGFISQIAEELVEILRRKES